MATQSKVKKKKGQPHAYRATPMSQKGEWGEKGKKQSLIKHATSCSKSIRRKGKVLGMKITIKPIQSHNRAISGTKQSRTQPPRLKRRRRTSIVQAFTNAIRIVGNVKKRKRWSKRIGG